MTQSDRLHRRFGTGVAAGALPAVYVVGFAALSPTLRSSSPCKSCGAG
jgi:hypothetical protein